MDKRTETIDSIVRNTGAPWAAVAAAYDAGAAAERIASAQPLTDAPLFWYRPCRDGLYEGPHHHNSVGGKMLRDEKPGEWVPLYASLAGQPLTDAQIVALVGPHADIVADSRGRMTYEFDSYGLIAFARLIRAAEP